ncbi:MAG: hypothetical protein H0X24_06275 [Ktedonobacterales bacterium]|nr:hypothetical protein [Ktedonobacterales bacterium]
MSQPSEPTNAWQSPDHSRPDPAAYLHADPMLPSADPSTPLLYPSGPAVPPPPPALIPSAPVYFSMLYPAKPHNVRKGIGVAVGIVCGLLLATALGIAAISGGFFPSSSLRASVPTPPATSVPAVGTSLPTNTALPGAANPTPGAHPTPGAQPPGESVTPQPTSTLAPGVTPTVTPLPPLAVTIRCNCPEDKHNANFAVQTAANATLTIRVVYCDGVPDTSVNTSGTADNSGAYATAWSPSHSPKGCKTATITVTATVGSQSGTGTGTLTFK